jgi:hypothetical protein
VSRAIEEANLLAQITRLGRLNALERLGDLMLELRERLELCGQLAQRQLRRAADPGDAQRRARADPVHVNRMVQQARRQGWLEWRAKRVTIRDPAAPGGAVRQGGDESAGRVGARPIA